MAQKLCSIKDNLNRDLRCRYYTKAQWDGITQTKYHLGRTRKNIAMCAQCPDDITKLFLETQKKNDDDKVFEKLELRVIVVV